MEFVVKFRKLDRGQIEAKVLVNNTRNELFSTHILPDTELSDDLQCTAVKVFNDPNEAKEWADHYVEYGKKILDDWRAKEIPMNYIVNH